MYKIDTRGIKLGIKPLVFHPNNTPGNIEQVPHYAFKVRNRDTRLIDWYGIYVHHIKPADLWSREDTDGLKRCMCAFMRSLGPNHQLATDLDDTLEHLLDISLRRKPSVIYGGNFSRVMWAHLTHGIELHVLREPDAVMLAYGGFVFRMDLAGAKSMFALVLHRGVAIYNHLDLRWVEEVIRDHLVLQFPFIFPNGVEGLHYLAMRERERNQKEICNSVAKRLFNAQLQNL